MTDTIVFYSNPMSRGRIVHWMLEEVGAPYRFELLNMEKSEHKTPAYLAINPMGKIPAIVHRGVVVTEAAAICAYLADAFPAAGLSPAQGDPARGTLAYGSYDDTLNALEPRASLQAYASRCSDRPAYKRADAAAMNMMQQK